MEQLDTYLWRVKGMIFMFEPDEYPEYEEKKNGEEQLRFCPACIHNGEPNSKETFYFNIVKMQGICHRCNAKFIRYSDKSESEIMLELAVRGFLNKHKEKPQVSLRKLPEINFEGMFREPSQFCKDFLAQRNPLLEGMEDFYQFRELPDTGVAVPIYYKGKIISYNLRFYEPPGKMKYYIPPGDKYLYSPNRALNRAGDLGEFTLVEGMFDAIGAHLDGFENPLAVNGSAMTDIQARQLSGMFPDRGNCYMDKTELSEALRRSVYSKMGRLQQLRVIRSDGHDPEERLVWKLMNYNEEYLMTTLERRDRILTDFLKSE